MNGFLEFVLTNKIDGVVWDFQIFVKKRLGTGEDELKTISDWQDWVDVYSHWTEYDEFDPEPEVAQRWLMETIREWRMSLAGNKPQNVRK